MLLQLSWEDDRDQATILDKIVETHERSYVIFVVFV